MVWKQQRGPGTGSAAVVYADGNLYFRYENAVMALIEATPKGEAPELLPVLGSSRLEEPRTRYSVTAVMHGHAHQGSPDGRTRGDIPVYNVAVPVLQRVFPERPPFRVIELPGG